MNDLQAMFAATLRIFQLEFSMYGFTFSFWQVFLFVIVGGILLTFIGRLFGDD